MSESDSDHDRAVELRAQIRAHNEAYHGRDVPTVPDSTYDELLRQLEEIETRRPDLTTADSQPVRLETRRANCSQRLSIAFR